MPIRPPEGDEKRRGTRGHPAAHGTQAVAPGLLCHALDAGKPDEHNKAHDEQDPDGKHS